MCWSQKSQGMMNICALLLVILMDLAVLHQLLPSHCNLYRFCSREPDTIRRTYDWKWGHGHPKNSSSRSVRIHSSSFPFILINLVRIYQGRVILIIPMHNVDHPCAYDFDWYDDGGDDADELDGISREHTTWGILSLVGIWVSLVSIFFFSFLFFFFLADILSLWLEVPKRRNGESGIGNGVRYRRKVISGGKGIDMQSGWMLWVFRGWDGFVSDLFIFIFLLLFFSVFLLVWCSWWPSWHPSALHLSAWSVVLAEYAEPSYFVPFLSCELLGRCCRLNPRGWVSIRLGDIFLVFGSTPPFFELCLYFLFSFISGLPLPKDWISVMYFSLERFTIKSWV